MPDLNHDWLLGAVGGFAIGCIMAAIFWEGPEPSQEQTASHRFKVVDNYNGCEVVRYEADGMAEYKYFLDCRKENDN